MSVYDVARIAFDPSERLLKATIREGLGAAASVADDTVMVLAARIDELEQRLAPPDLEPAYRAHAVQLSQDLVDTRGADRPPVLTDLLTKFGCHEPSAGACEVYVLGGQLRLILGDEDLVLHPGEAAEFSTSTPHWMSGIGGPAEVLVLMGHHGERAHLRVAAKPGC